MFRIRVPDQLVILESGSRSSAGIHSQHLLILYKVQGLTLVEPGGHAPKLLWNVTV